MTENPSMRPKLRDLIDSLSLPASLVAWKTRTIFASNSAMIRTFGIDFAEMRKLRFDFSLRSEAMDTLKSAPLSLQIQGRSPIPTFHLCPEGATADFELILFSPRTALLYEPPANSHEHSPGSVPEEIRAGTHFSYLYNFTSDVWSYSNPEPLRHLGLLEATESPSRLVWRDWILPEDRGFYDEILASALLHGGNHHAHYRIRNRQGRILEVDDYCGVTEPEGKWPVLIGAAVCQEPFGERVRKAERQILVGRMIGGMIHDFKNLLGGIQNMIEWSSAKTENPEIRKALGKTITYTDQATRLIRTVLDVSSGKHSRKTETLRLSSILAESEELLRRIIPASIQLDIRIEDEIPPVFGQAGLLKDMLLNLAVNARDAMKACGDKLSIAIARKTRTDAHGNHQSFVELSIADNGCGMSEQETRRLFEAFYSTKETGTGLGLWMVKEAVRAFDGEIHVESAVGKGTVFTILFPVAKEESSSGGFVESSEESNIARKHGHSSEFETFVFPEGNTVLFVEDEPLIRNGVASWLESWGIAVLVAADGLEALDLFEEHHASIDLVIQDFILPGKRGDELLDVFHSRAPRIPVIVTSANTSGTETEEFKRRGARVFLEKPFRMEQLFNILHELLIPNTDSQ
jgi:signal transduction histidine kinase/ActR/RegA family two-component response regulator